MDGCNNWDLRPLQLAALSMFKAFAAICEKHDLRYYAIYGTALGAVRHHGFIPWDDDFDVVMPRPDFVKFVGVARKELPETFRFVRGGEAECSPLYHAQIIDSRIGVVEDLSRRTNLKLIYPPFIDIFVLDGVPDGVLTKRRIWGFRRRMRFCQLYRHPQSAFSVSARRKRILWAIRIFGMVLSWFYPKTRTNEEFMCLLDAECARRNPFPGAKKYMEVNFFRMKKERLIDPVELEPVRVLPFEDTFIRVPFKVEDILSRYYGDFMKYPEEASRVPAHQLRVMYKEHI